MILEITGLILNMIGTLFIALQVFEEEVIRKWGLKFRYFFGSFTLESYRTPEMIGTPILFNISSHEVPEIHGVPEIRDWLVFRDFWHLLLTLAARRLCWALHTKVDFLALSKGSLDLSSVLKLAPDLPFPHTGFNVIALDKLSYDLLSNILLAYFVTAIVYSLDREWSVTVAIWLLFPLILSLVIISVFRYTTIIKKPPTPNDLQTLELEPDKYKYNFSKDDWIPSLFCLLFILPLEFVKRQETYHLPYFFAVAVPVGLAALIHYTSRISTFMFQRERVAILKALNKSGVGTVGLNYPLSWGILPRFRFFDKDPTTGKLKLKTVWVLTDKAVVILHAIRSTVTYFALFLSLLYSILYFFRACFAAAITFPLRCSYWLSDRLHIKSAFYLVGLSFLLIGFFLQLIAKL